ncbi:MAG: beta-ketoacyl synthase N-terminal-like domain-containing protein [Acidobacteriota bacterium]
MKRIGIYGWGLVAPRSPDIDAFADNLETAESWLEPFNGFGPDTFLVGKPEFAFERYREWIDRRFPPNRYPQLAEKMDPMVQYAIGAFIQALGQNPGMEQALQELGTDAHVYVGTGLGALPTLYDESVALHRAQRRWDRFWADPERNRALAEHLRRKESAQIERERELGAPPHPDRAEGQDREAAEEAWWHYWAARSERLEQYLDELTEVESLKVEGSVQTAKMAVMKEKRRRYARLQQKWQAPEPPWKAVSANVVWNIANIPAAQISMLGQITGPTFAPVAACSTFGVALKLASDAIRSGRARAVVVGATDPPPHPLIVGGFYNARVISADGRVSKPLSELRGTHVAGGSVLWILGDLEHMESRGFKPLGMEPLAVGVTSDADHIITPSTEGPSEAIREALRQARIDPASLGTWDLHATATPGDYTEIETLKGVVEAPVMVTARKGIHGHGMSAAGGWELTAQYLAYERGHLFPTPLAESELNPEISKIHQSFVFDSSCDAPPSPAGKLSMGVGGVNACVISRPWDRS